LNASKQSIATVETNRGPELSSSSTVLENLPTDRAATTEARMVDHTLRVQTNNDANPSSTSEPWMKTVVISTFGEFQKEIFPIIDSIVSKSQYKDNSFVKQWKIHKKNARKPMCSTITWRNVKALLNIQDLQQYRAYLQ